MSKKVWKTGKRGFDHTKSKNGCGSVVIFEYLSILWVTRLLFRRFSPALTHQGSFDRCCLLFSRFETSFILGKFDKYLFLKRNFRRVIYYPLPQLNTVNRPSNYSLWKNWCFEVKLVVFWSLPIFLENPSQKWWKGECIQNPINIPSEFFQWSRWFGCRFFLAH